MPPATDERLRELKLRYKTAYAAYQGSALALGKGTTIGKHPSPELLGNEEAALRELTAARAKFLTALQDR